VAFTVHILGEASYYLGLRWPQINGDLPVIHWNSGAAHAPGHDRGLAHRVESKLQSKGQGKDAMVRPRITD
jgi:hypothetical protein